LNSFLGAQAHPWENLKAELSSIPIGDAERQGWPIPQSERAADKLPQSLGDLIGWLRHGVAHGNISFLPGGHGEIAALRIENRNKEGLRTWGADRSGSRERAEQRWRRDRRQAAAGPQADIAASQQTNPHFIQSHRLAGEPHRRQLKAEWGRFR
jgi:hypothetical protein